MSVIIDLADDVVDVLNSGTFTQSFVATRAYVPAYELTDLSTLRVTVVPRELSLVPLTRHADQGEYQIDVAIQKIVGRSNADIDPFMNLAEEIIDLCRGLTMSLTTNARCTGVANTPIYDPGHLDERRVFTSVITLTFALTRGR
jgi:hypothetical protein